MGASPRPKLCLSYSPEDQELIEEFTLVLAGTVAVDLDDILATTRLAANGSEQSDKATEVASTALSADVLLAFVSESALHAPSVMVELGARSAQARSSDTAPRQRTLLVLLHGLSSMRLPHLLRQHEIYQGHEREELSRLLDELGDAFGQRAESRGRLLPAERERRLGRILELARPTGAAPAPVGPSRRRRVRILAGAAGVLLGLLATVIWLRLGSRASGSPPKYDFEQDAAGWSRSGGCTDANLSTEESKSGQSALALSMGLDGSDPNRQFCEAWVELGKSAPRGGGAVPADLSGRRVTAWVYTPRGAVGNRQKPSGLQLFVKDNAWRAAYGRWRNVAGDRWTRLEFVVSSAPLPGQFVAPGFDPTRIIAVGVKMSLGGDPSARFEGSVYLDAVDW